MVDKLGKVFQARSAVWARAQGARNHGTLLGTRAVSVPGVFNARGSARGAGQMVGHGGYTAGPSHLVEIVTDGGEWK